MTPSQAYTKVYKAVKEGRLTPLESCELCGAKGKTIGHHWNGHDNPLDVWYVCHSCNSALCGRHDGSLTQEQAREFIAAKEQSRRWIVACQSRKNPNVWYIEFQGNEIRARKDYQRRVNSWRSQGVALLNPLQEVIESKGDTSTLFD